MAKIASRENSVRKQTNRSDFKNGHGTTESPYEITSVEEFNNVRYHLDAHFKQMDNLDLSGSEFSPIGSVTFPFTGYYDGGKYQISNLNIKQNSNNIGLFSYVDNGGVVENLKIVKAEIAGEYNVGAIAGINRGLIIGCVSSANVSGNGSVGGIVGLNAVGGEIKECGNTGNVSSTKIDGMYIGGIVGVNNAFIQNCYNHGRINLDHNTAITYSGGIVGLNDGGSYNAEIDRCYNIGAVNGNARGQVAGDNIKGKINNCKWLASELNKAASFDSGIISDAVVMDKNKFQSASSFNGWDFDKTWRYIKTKSEYPLLNREYIKVESVSFEQNDIKLRQGSSIELKAVIKPVHATENTAKLKLNSNIAGVKLSSDNVLSIAKTVKPETVINITASAETKSAKLTVTVTKIPVESVKLTNLDGKNEISSLHGLHFKGEISPNDATYKDIKYEVDSSFAEITSDGFLTIKENTPIGTKITVSGASVDNPMLRDSITVSVVKEPVTSVTITSNTSFKVNGSLKLSATVLPNEATYKDVAYKIIASTADGANLTDNVLTAKGLGIITVIAEADGVKSEEFKIQVLKESVTDIVWNIKDRITCGDILVLNATVIPANATFSEIQYSIIGDNTARASIIDGVLHAETAGKVIVRAIADEFISDKEITIDKVPVDNIELNFADSFKHTESLTLNVNVTPDNATYKDNIVYEIISDSADSRIVSGVLYANKPGTVVVKVTVDGISVEKIISVLKEPVQSISLNAVFKENDSGEAYQFIASIYPATATNQDVVYVLKSGAATLSETGLLLIDPSAPVGSLIEVYAIVDGIESSVYEIKSGRISVKSVSLTAESYTVKVGEGLSLVTSTVPAVVSNPGVTYIVEGNAEVIDGVLYVFDSEAVGTIINVKAIVDGVESSAINVNVIETLVENITFTCATSFKVTGSLKLSASVYPQNATDKTVIFTIISGEEYGAEIIDGYLYAQKVGVIKVRATAGNISRDLVICVQKEPVTTIVLTSPLLVKVYNNLKLTATAYPFNATNKEITFELVNNDINAEIIDGNMLFSSQVGKVTLRVVADGIHKDFEIEITREPVTGIVFGKTVFKHTENLNLVTRVLPTNATYNDVSYTILKDYVGYEDIGARIENGRLYANRPGLIKLLVVTDNGEYSEIVEIEVTKEPVVGITMADYDKLLLDYGFHVGQIDLGTLVYPFNATYQDVEYYISGKNCEFVRNGNIVTVTLIHLETNDDGFAADKQASITVKAVADGVEFYKTYVFHKFDLADENDIVFNPDGKTFKTSGRFDFSIMLPENITYKALSVTIDEEVKNALGVEFNFDNKTNSGYITANYPGTIPVHVISLCGGTSTDFEIIVEKEMVNTAVLGLRMGENSDTDEIYKDGEQSIEAIGKYKPTDTLNWKSYTGIEVQQGSEILFRAFGYAADKTLPVTYGKADDFTLKFYKDGKEITKLNGLDNYLNVSGDKITIALNAPVTDEIYVCAVAKNGVESKRTKLVIQFKFIKEVKSMYITSNGVITGLESIVNEENKDKADAIEKVIVRIRHSSTGIVLTKEIYTNVPTVVLQLYNKGLGGYFDVEYEVHFIQKISNREHRYSYKREFKKEVSNDNSFKGLSSYYYSYFDYASDYSGIVWLDNYTNNASMYEFGNKIKAVYVYNSSYVTKNTSYKFIGDSTNQIDLYLHNYGINAPTNKDAILVNNGASGLKLVVTGNSNLIGGSGSSCNSGKSGINCSGALAIEGDVLNVYGGTGGTGYVGDQGSQGSEGGRDGDGYGTKGGTGGVGATGGNGYTGGSAIVCKALSININSLSVTGGKGGTGGRGGKGGTGGTGGSGRDGGAAKYSREGGDGGTGGTGGQGGNGGTGGYAIKATSVNKSVGKITLSGGAAGYAGAGGYAGDGGQGGAGGKYWTENKYRPNGNKGDSGSTGSSGSSGNSGSALFGISLNGSNVTIIYQ